jgi:hypothetical protein
MTGPSGNPLQVQLSSAAGLRKFASGGYLYGLLDAYDNPAVPQKVQELGQEFAVSLFVGAAEKKCWDLAPYLIAVQEATLDWMMQTIWNAPCGVFILSRSGLETLRTHFRRFLIVQLPDGERWYFRYYDPRILKIYLSNCHADELEVFFGPVRAFGVPEPESDQVSFLHTGHEVHAVTQSSQAAPSLRIRREQYQALDKATSEDFEGRVIKFLKNAFPGRCRSLGDQGIRDVVRYGTKAAARYGFTRENDQYQFVELIFLLGSKFDQNPNLPWVQAILHDSREKDSSIKMARLRQAAAEHIAQATRNDLK